MPIAAACRHEAPLSWGRPEIESQLQDLSRSWPVSLSLSLPLHFLSHQHCPIIIKANKKSYKKDKWILKVQIFEIMYYLIWCHNSCIHNNFTRMSSVRFLMFLKEVSYDHQGCIYLSNSNIVKYYTNFNCFYMHFMWWQSWIFSSH